MENDLIMMDNQLTILKDFDFRVLVPSEDWIPEDTNYTFEVDPSISQDVDDDSAVVLEKTDNKASSLDYGIAAASGLLTGALSILWMKEFSLENAKEIGDEQANKWVVNIAKSQGFKPKVGDSEEDILRKAIRHLENKFPSLGDKLTNEFGCGLNHHLRDFSHHFSIIGLICSILMQFTGKGYGTNTNGDFIVLPIPENAIPSDKFVRRVINGTVCWAFHIVSDMAGSSTFPGKGTGVPGVIVSLLKEASTLPFFRNLKLNHNNNEISFSQWVSKLFNGTLIRDKDGNPLRFDLRAEMGFAKMLKDQAKPVLINECIVRGFYFISRFIKELKEKRVSSITDLGKMDASRFLPYRNRALTRMLTVSSGVFVIVNVSGAAITSAIESGGNAATMLSHFFLRINYVGAVRFTVACIADAKYIGEEVREMLDRYLAEKKDYLAGRSYEPNFRFIRFTDQQIRYLYSLEWNMMQYDMIDTKLDQATLKASWMEKWKEKLFSVLDNPQPDYLIDDEKLLYSKINYDATKEDRPFWLFAFAMELIRFTPYYSLDDNTDYGKLKFKYDYLRDVFCQKQSFITMEDITKLKNLCSGYEKWVRGDLGKLLINVGMSFAFAFVPFISLTMHILGIGIATIIGELGTVSHIYTLNECSKLITLCDYVILGEKPEYKDYVEVSEIFWEVKRQAELLEEQIKESVKNKEKSEKIKAMKSSKEYLNNCASQLNKLLRRKGFSENTFYVPALLKEEK